MPEDIRNAVIENQTIELAADDSGVGLVGCTFRNCVIVGRVSSSNLAVVNTRFENCEIRWKVPLKHENWRRSTVFDRCTFHGQFIGNMFGHRKGRDDAGDIMNCDFRNVSNLNGTSFENCDMAGIQLPMWPHFTFMEIHKHKEALLRLAPSFPLRFGTTLEVVADSPPDVCAVVWSAKNEMKRTGLSEAEVLAYVKQIPGVVF